MKDNLVTNANRNDEWELIDNDSNWSTRGGMDAGSSKSGTARRIHADLLIPGKGKPVKNTTVIASDGKIAYIGPPDRIPSKYSELSAFHVPVLMPGLFDCHCHFVGASPNKPIDVASMGLMNPAEAGARCVKSLRDTLYAGYTSCVDLGGYAPELQRVIDEGSVLGPTLYGTGAALSQTAGHGDMFEVPLGIAHYRLSVNAPGADTTGPFIYADGIEECRKAVRTNLRRGAKITKVFTSGGVTSRDDSPQLQQYSDEELKVIVDESSRMGLVCAAHAIGAEGIKAAIRAGFKIIEHGSYLDAEIIKEMKQKNVMLVGTILPIIAIRDNPQSFPPAMAKKAAVIVETHLNSYRLAIKSGVSIALGSDLFGGPGTPLGPGKNGGEIVYAVTEGGMTPLQAIEAATANGPLTLGLKQAPKAGQIREGWDADFIALETNPLEKIEVFRDPKQIKWIWKAGKLVKGPGVDYWEVLDA